MNNVLLVSIVCASLALCGCERAEGTPTSREQQPLRPGTTSDTPNAPGEGSRLTDRDRATGTPTPTPTPMPGDREESEADRKLSQMIHQNIAQDDALSVMAKNVRITTTDGVVSLNGSVKTEKQKEDLAKRIQGVQGVKRVDNQLTVTPD